MSHPYLPPPPQLRPRRAGLWAEVPGSGLHPSTEPWLKSSKSYKRKRVVQSVFLLLKYVADYVKLTVSALPGPYLLPLASRSPCPLSTGVVGGLWGLDSIPPGAQSWGGGCCSNRTGTTWMKRLPMSRTGRKERGARGLPGALRQGPTGRTVFEDQAADTRTS